MYNSITNVVYFFFYLESLNITKFTVSQLFKHQNINTTVFLANQMCFLVVIVFTLVWAPYTFVCAVHIFYEDMPIYLTGKIVCSIYYLSIHTFHIMNLIYLFINFILIICICPCKLAFLLQLRKSTRE